MKPLLSRLRKRPGSPATPADRASAACCGWRAACFRQAARRQIYLTRLDLSARGGVGQPGATTHRALSIFDWWVQHASPARCGTQTFATCRITWHTTQQQPSQQPFRHHRGDEAASQPPSTSPPAPAPGSWRGAGCPAARLPGCPDEPTPAARPAAGSSPR